MYVHGNAMRYELHISAVFYVCTYACVNPDYAYSDGKSLQ